MKKLFVFLAIIAVVILACHTKRSRSENHNIAVRYTSPQKLIHIVNDQISITTIIQSFENPVSAVPTSVSESTSSAELKKEDIEKLVKDLENTGFFALDSNAYGAPEMERFYPYTLDVKIGNKMKKVIYRSNPSFSSSPEAFTKAEAVLNEIASLHNLN